MLLKDLIEKAQTGPSNTMYDNIDNINGEFKVFALQGDIKIYYYSSERLDQAIEKMNYYKENGLLNIKPEKKVSKKANLKEKIKTKVPTVKINKAKIKTINKWNFKSQKYRNRIDPVVYDPSMIYKPNPRK